MVALSLLSIESELAREIDFNDIIDVFAKDKARKVPLWIKYNLSLYSESLNRILKQVTV